MFSLAKNMTQIINNKDHSAGGVLIEIKREAIRDLDSNRKCNKIDLCF